MFLSDIVTRLQVQGVGTPNVNIFGSSKAQIPAGVGPYLTVMETGGSAPTRQQNQAPAATQRPTAQILVRAQSYAEAFAMARAAYNALDGLFNEALSGTFYLSVTARQEPMDLGHPDDAGRVMVAFNIEAEKYS